MTLYRYIPIWLRASNGISLYRCFEVLGEGFTVQSKDFYTMESIRKNASLFENQFLDLLLEQAPEARFKPQPTIQAAIESFDAHFRR